MAVALVMTTTVQYAKKNKNNVNRMRKRILLVNVVLVKSWHLYGTQMDAAKAGITVVTATYINVT